MPLASLSFLRRSSASRPKFCLQHWCASERHCRRKRHRMVRESRPQILLPHRQRMGRRDHGQNGNGEPSRLSAGVSLSLFSPPVCVCVCLFLTPWTLTLAKILHLCVCACFGVIHCHLSVPVCNVHFSAYSLFTTRWSWTTWRTR